VKRLWLDANVVIRFLVREPQEMAAEAAELMKRAEAGEVRLYLSPLVLAEIVWVLKSFYSHPLTSISDVLLTLVSAPGVEVDDLESTIKALELTAARNVDFADAYLAVRAAAEGAKVCTFDRTDFRRLPVEWVRPAQVG